MRNLDSIDLGVNFAVIHDRPGARHYLVLPGLDGNAAVLVHHGDGTRERLRTFYSVAAAVRWAADRLAGRDTRA